MICPRCNKNIATVHVFEIEDVVTPEEGHNKVEQHDLCEVCAQGANLPQSSPTGTIQEIGGMGLWKLLKTAQVKVQVTQASPACPQCGMTLAELQHKGRVGCANDYEFFKPYLAEVLERMHGDVQHVGRLPGVDEGEAENQQRVVNLRRALELAVRQEDYERAAVLRDELAALAPPDAEPSAEPSAEPDAGPDAGPGPPEQESPGPEAG